VSTAVREPARWESRFEPVTVVLLHPLPLDGSVWSDEMRALGPSVVAPTLYDLGDSIESWAGAVVDIAGPGPLVVVGNSIGGSCAIEVAYRVPERVKLIVLIGSKPGHRREPELRDAAVRLLAEDGMHAAWPAYWEPLFAPTADASIVRRGREIAFAQPLDAVVRGVRAFHTRQDRTALLGQLDVPVLVVRGEHDRIPRHGAALAASLHHGDHRVVDGAGHYVPLERPDPLAALVGQAIEHLPDYP
jgi:pimeloyl-ACP methyl ester carboxylesterase